MTTTGLVAEGSGEPRTWWLVWDEAQWGMDALADGERLTFAIDAVEHRHHLRFAFDHG